MVPCYARDKMNVNNLPISAYVCMNVNTHFPFLLRHYGGLSTLGYLLVHDAANGHRFIKSGQNYNTTSSAGSVMHEGKCTF